MSAEKLLEVIRAPHISEKATLIAEKNNQIIFKVLKSANKHEIKAAVESLYNVKVKNVSVMNVKGKTKRFKQKEGKRSDWKKALVSLFPGNDIDFTVAE